MLLAGATDPPPAVKISDRRTREGKGRWVNTARSGSFLRGVSCDLANMEQQQQVIRNLYNTVRDFYMKKEEAKTEIKELFEDCKARNAVPVIYYTGHGEVGTGNWCFSDGTVTIQVGRLHHLLFHTEHTLDPSPGDRGPSGGLRSPSHYCRLLLQRQLGEPRGHRCGQRLPVPVRQPGVQRVLGLR